MILKYTVKHSTPADAPGQWHQNGRVKFDAQGLTKEQTIRIEKAINEAVKI